MRYKGAEKHAEEGFQSEMYCCLKMSMVFSLCSTLQGCVLHSGQVLELVLHIIF